MTNERTRVSLFRDTQSLCFYGVEMTPTTTEQFFMESDSLAKSFGLSFDSMGFLMPESYKVKRMKFNLEKLIVQNNDNSWANIIATKTWKTGWKSDYFMMAMISETNAIITFAEFDFSLESSQAESHLIDMASVLRSPYSIYFNLPYVYCPYLHCAGIGTSFIGEPTEIGPQTVEEKDRFCRWGFRGIREKVWLDGYIRDVYPLNCLCKQQINRFDIRNNGIPIRIQALDTCVKDVFII